MTSKVKGIWDTLTKAQIQVASMVAINQDLGHPQAVTAVLERLGVIESYVERMPGIPPVDVTRYRMPLHMHQSWARWCATKDGEKP